MAKIRRHERDHPYTGDGIRPAPVRVEETFDDFVESFGGIKIAKLLPDKSAQPLNADYLFRHDNVVAELKVLEGSFAGSNGIGQLIKGLAQAGVKQADINAYVFRGVPLPPGAWSVVNKRFRRFIEDRIKKGRAQLRRSRADFGDAHTKSVLLLANEKLKLVRDSYIFRTICNVMAHNYTDEHIDAVIYFSPNVFSFFPSAEREYSSWIPIYTDPTDEELGDFINRLGESWLKFYTAKCGQPDLPILQLPDTREGVEGLRGHRRRI
jgi:hypothetical protein